MAILAKTDPNGERLTANAAAISNDPLAIGGVSLNLDAEPSPVLAQNDYLIIGHETVKKTDAGASSPHTILRSQNDANANATVAAAHEAGVFMRSQTDPHELLSYAFAGADFSGLTVWGEAQFWAAIKRGSAVGPLMFASDDYPVIEFYRPQYTPASETWTILVWTRATRMFSAEIFN